MSVLNNIKLEGFEKTDLDLEFNESLKDETFKLIVSKLKIDKNTLNYLLHERYNMLNIIDRLLNQTLISKKHKILILLLREPTIPPVSFRRRLKRALLRMFLCLPP